MPTATPFNNLITFSRGSNATVTGPNGLIQWAPNNLLLNSEQFNDAYWIKLNASVTANTSTAPDGSATADTLASTSSVSNTTGAYRGISYAVGHSLSVYVKAGTSSIAWVSSNTGESYGVFNLTTGSVIGSANGTATITPVGSGWFRIAVENVTVAGTFFIVGGKDSYSTGHPWASGTWTSGNTIHVWGAQLELGSTATTYNPTTVKNLLGFSEAFDNAAWNKVSSSIVTGAQANPVNGLFNAQKLMEGTDAAGKQVTQGATTTANPFTFSSYVKAAGRNWAVLAITDSGSVVRRGFFNLATGAVGTTDAGITASITSVGSGWYRCAITIAASLAGTTTCRIYLSNDGVNTSYTGDGNSGVYIYGAQLSDSASLDPYVPTPGAAPSSTAFYGPRFDFDPVTLQPRGLLVEEQRTNLLTYSDDWSNAAWTKQQVTITTNATLSPDGTTNADKIAEDSSTAFHRAFQTVTKAASAIAYTYTVFVKAAERTTASVFIQDSGVFAQVDINLLTGALSNIVGTVSATNFGNGWWRVSVSGTSGTTTTALCMVASNNGGSFAGTTGFGIFTYGAQLEAGAFATSYIPTVASTVTRSADVATVSGQNFAQWFANNEGSFVFEGSSFGIGSNLPTFLNASDGTTNNYLRMNGASGYTGRSFVQSGGATSANITVGAGLASGVNIKTAAVYAANSFQLAVNAILGTEDTSGAVPVTPNQIAFGNWFGSAGTILNGHIRNIRFIPARAADFQLQALST